MKSFELPQDTVYAFEFVDTSSKRGSGKLPGNVAIISNTKNAKRITFGAEFSRNVISRGFKSLRLACNKITGEYAFVFSKGTEGHILRVTTKNNANEVTTTTINSETLVTTIMKVLGITGDHGRIEMGVNSSKHEDAYFCLINKI